jgi:hypothetical protein
MAAISNNAARRLRLMARDVRGGFSCCHDNGRIFQRLALERFRNKAGICSRGRQGLIDLVGDGDRKFGHASKAR